MNDRKTIGVLDDTLMIDSSSIKMIVKKYDRRILSHYGETGKILKGYDSTLVIEPATVKNCNGFIIRLDVLSERYFVKYYQTLQLIKDKVLPGEYYLYYILPAEKNSTKATYVVDMGTEDYRKRLLQGVWGVFFTKEKMKFRSKQRRLNYSICKLNTSNLWYFNFYNILPIHTANVGYALSCYYNNIFPFVTPCPNIQDCINSMYMINNSIPQSYDVLDPITFKTYYLFESLIINQQQLLILERRNKKYDVPSSSM